MGGLLHLVQRGGAWAGVKEWCDLENMARVRSRSLEMAPSDRSHTSSYSPSIVTMAISFIVCEI